MKRVLSIQDLSCLGKCSLTVALPVLSAMGCSCSVMPTTLLSTHTAFPAPHRRSLTEDLLPICRHWQSIGAKFEAIGVGYLADPQQAATVEAVLDAFGGFVVIDPVMGDHGKLYSSLTQDHVEAMKRLCRRGSVLLPNVTEAALLTGIPYRQTGDPAYYRQLLAGMQTFGADAVVITGASTESGKTGFVGWSEATGKFSYQNELIPRQCHGTGDLFAAVLTGAIVRGNTVEAAATLAARFVEKVIAATPESTPFGVEFESQLPWLWNQL